MLCILLVILKRIHAVIENLLILVVKITAFWGIRKSITLYITAESNTRPHMLSRFITSIYI